MSRYEYDIAVLGGGAAGLTVTAGAARAGAKTLLIEKEGRLGGDCLYYGCVPSKTLIRTAQVAHLIRNSAEYGLPGMDLPPVDFSKVAERIQSVIGKIQKHDSEERFCKLGAKVLYGDARFIDEHSVSLNGRIYSAHSWVIATGSSPALPPIEGIDATACLTNKDMFSLKKLPRSMVILGGGPVGIEFAQAFTRLGTKVSVIERLGSILGADDEDMTSALREILETEGVQFFLDSAVIRVNDLGDEKEVIYTKGNETKGIRSEAIVVAAGRNANLSGLGIESIGVALDRRGLKLDARLRTTQKHIYGAGDVTGSHQFTHAAGYEGGIVVSNAVFHLPRKADYAYFPWVTYTDPELANIGMNEKAANAAGVRYTVWKEEFGNVDRSLAEGSPAGKIKMLLDDREKPLGIQILGPHAGDLINEWVAILNGNMKLSKIASSIHPYPTLGEITKRVAGAYLAPKIFSEKVRKGLRFLFNFKGRACGDDDEER